MNTTGAAQREISVPVSIFGSLRAELEKEAGTLPAVHALHHAGYQTGAVAAATFAAGGGAEQVGQDAFWGRLDDFFGERGWGSLQHSTIHRAVGLLSSTDWAEASPDDTDPEASCFFTTGFLSGLLSDLAGGPVAVLEVGCRTRGGSVCQFAFGSESAIHDLYGRLLEGVDLDRALEAL